MTTHTPEQICRAAFPQARVFPASELALDWKGTAIELGQTMYVVYEDDDGDWMVDAIDLPSWEAGCSTHATLAAALGAVLATHTAATFA